MFTDSISQSIFDDSINRSSIPPVIVLAFVSAALLSGQQAVFRGGVELVEVTVSVTDENGRAVTDLRLEDFELRESGTPHAIALFDRIEVPLPPPVPEDAPRMPSVVADVASNEFQENGRAFAIIIDDLPLVGWKTQTVRRLARQFVERHAGPSDLLMVLATSGRSAPTQEFTADKARVLQAIDRVVGVQYELPTVNAGWTPFTRALCEPQYEAVSMLDTMKMLATHLAGVKRRRLTVIFISEGFNPDANNPKCPPTAQPTVKVIEELQKSNVTLYALDPYLETGTPSDGTRLLAESTGGYASLNFQPGTSRDFDRIIQESSHYYLLGYYPTERRSEGQFRSIDVRVRRPDVKISNRKGYVYRTPRPADEPAPPPALRETPVMLASLLDHPLPTPGLPMRVQAIPLRQTDTLARVQLIVEVAGANLTFESRDGQFVERLEFATVPFDEKGVRGVERASAVNLRLNAAGRDRVLRSGVRWVSVLDLPPGRHDLRVAGHAMTSDLRGSVFVDVDIPKFGTDVATSGLAVTSPTAEAMVTTGGPSLLPPLPWPPTSARVFALGETLSVSAEVYGAGSGDPAGRLPTALVARVTDAAPPQRLVLEHDVPVLTDGHATPYVSFPLDTARLGPGRFVLRIVRRSGDTPADDAPGAVVFEILSRSAN